MICVDPGLRGCGVACFTMDVLAWAGYVNNPQLSGRGPASYHTMASAVGTKIKQSTCCTAPPLVVELPVVYPGVSKIDTNDLLDLAGVDGAMAEHFFRLFYFSVDEIRHVTPREWKGQVPKEIMNRRVLSKLNDIEKTRIQKVGAKDHNTLDAIGIGLHMLGRLK